MSEFEAGTAIDGRYRVLHRLGAGGMADVYLAQDEQLDREVALKLLHRRFAEDPGFVERFRREAQAAASLQHPNVVSVFDRGAFDGTYYIAMEYLQGRTLKRLIRDDAPLETSRAIDLTIQMLKAARFAHRRGVIHRDLKPHNVIVDDNDHVKVTDFGIARAGASDMTETGSIMGTAQYLSPEQAQGHAVSAPSDLYSVGIVLYEMLTGRVPFDGESPVSIALKHVSEAPVPPSQFNPEIPSALEQVVLWALNKQPADRPADADEFILALEQVREALAAPAGEVTASMRAISAGGSLIPAAEFPHTSIMQPADALSAYGGVTRPSVNGDRLDRYDDEDRPSRQSSPIWPWIAGLLLLLLIGGGVAAFVLTRPKKAIVPSVVYLKLPVAQAQIQNRGFTVYVIPENSKYPSGEVIGQNPLGHSRAKQGSTVTLTVSQGPGTTTVPTVQGLDETAAKAQLKQNGLTLARVVRQSSGTAPQGQVIGTAPAAGASVGKGQGVVLYVSSGLAMPSVVGDTLGDAQNALTQFTNAGNQIKITYQTTTTAQADTVINQAPGQGQSVARNGVITLTVAKVPDTVKVPRVVGETPSAALSTLSGLGLNVDTLYKTTHNPSMVGLVVQQLPTSLSIVKKGTVISIWVGQPPSGSNGGGGSSGIGAPTTATTNPSSGTTTTSNPPPATTTAATTTT